MPPVKKITSWSFSRYSTYRQCPAKLKFTAIDKLKEPPNEAMARGSHIHALAEHYIKGELKKLPPELKQFDGLFSQLKAAFKRRTLLNVVEDSWAFTKSWTRTTWDNWSECWLRIKLDHALSVDGETLVINDWKTGKFRQDSCEDYQEQLELYALAALLLYPHIKQVRPRLVYLDLGMIYPKDDEPIIYTRADVPRLKKLWLQRTKAMLSDTKFAPKPNRFCQWCHFRKANGGPCRF